MRIVLYKNCSALQRTNNEASMVFNDLGLYFINGIENAVDNK